MGPIAYLNRASEKPRLQTVRRHTEKSDSVVIVVLGLVLVVVIVGCAS